MKREFPEHPIVGVGGVVIHSNHVLLIRRGREPLKGEWSIPGGMLELGEGLVEGVRREIKEETGLTVEPFHQIATFDRIMWENISGTNSRVRYHYVIIDYVCRLTGGELAPASDVVDARWVTEESLPDYKLTEMATSVIRRAFEFCEARSPGFVQ